MKEKILFKFCSRSRPEKFLAGINNIMGMVADKENYKILVSADTDDETMCCPKIYNAMMPHIVSGKVILVFGISKSKVDAINRDFDKVADYDYKIICNFSDDMEFVVKGFDDKIRNHFAHSFPDFNGNLNYDNGYNGNAISTMSIIGRVYFDIILKQRVYDDEYFSLFCDNEYTEVAKMLNKMAYYPETVYKHNHPANNSSVPTDEQYRRTESFFHQDMATYERRKLNKFGLN